MVEGISNLSSPAAPSDRDIWSFPAGTVPDRAYRLMNDFKSEGNKSQHLRVNLPLTNIKNDLRTLEDKKLLAIQRLDKTESIFNTWNHSTALFSGICGIASILGGAFVMPSHPTVGWRLVATGAAMLANTILSEKEGWEIISSHLSFGNSNLKNVLDIALPLLFSVASLGSIAYHLKPLHGIYNYLPRVNQTIQILTSVIGVGKMITQVQKIFAEIEVQKVDNELQVKNIQLNGCLASRKPLSDTNTRIDRNFRQRIINVFTRF